MKMYANHSRHLSLLSVIFLLLLFNSACKRKADPEPPSVIGNWTGQYSTSAAVAPNIFFDPMTLKASGVLEGSDRTGTYNVAGSVLTATYVRSGNTFSFRCDIKENFTKMEGTWGASASQTNGGKILLTKQ